MDAMSLNPIKWSNCIALLLMVSGITWATAAETLKRDDVAWLNRITYGVNSTTAAQYRQLGRTRFLNAQFNASDTALPAEIAAQIASLKITNLDVVQQLAAINAENQRINALPDETAKQDARKVLNDQGNALAYEAARRHLLNAIYAPAQLQEQLDWFWLNHFSVFQGKGNIRWLIGDYEQQAIRPHVLGKFRDLVLATLKHPAMLQYLDNAQNANGKINENYARELMELHTLGVDAGYTQQDVQELARILTGTGINVGTAPKVKAEWQPLYRREGAFEFNPARHDFGDKMLLGNAIKGSGFDEVEHAVDVLVAQPACARFITRKLGEYFLGAPPPPKLQQQLAAMFQKTKGDIAAVLRTLFASSEFNSSLGKAFKDPMHYVISSVRFAYAGKAIANTHPIINWLNALGEPLYGRQTPDGYPLDETSWSSSGQMSKRFEIARVIGSGNAGLFEPEDGSGIKHAGFPQLATQFYFENIESNLSPTTRTALEQATSQTEWNTYLLSSPELNYR